MNSRNSCYTLRCSSVYSCRKTRTNVSSPLVCLFLIMNSICRGNNAKSPFRSNIYPISGNWVPISRRIFFSFRWQCIYAEMCANSIRHIRCKISIRLPYVEEVGHPVPYIVPSGTICMIIRRVAEEHLGRCGGQGGDFLEPGKKKSLSLSLFSRLVPLVELRERGRLREEMIAVE